MKSTEEIVLIKQMDSCIHVAAQLLECGCHNSEITTYVGTSGTIITKSLESKHII